LFTAFWHPSLKHEKERNPDILELVNTFFVLYAKKSKEKLLLNINVIPMKRPKGKINVEALIKTYGTLYSETLGIDLESGKSKNRGTYPFSKSSIKKLTLP
jgi:hypothetical protein